VLLAIFLGASLMALCGAFPASVLGVLLAFAGMELALVCRDQTSRTDAFAMLLTTAACMGLNNIALGFLLGLTMAWCLRLGVFQVEDRGEAK
jgi:MFS superfamily sulfate permease-like transporter